MAAEILFGARARNWLRLKFVAFKAVTPGFDGEMDGREGAIGLYLTFGYHADPG